MRRVIVLLLLLVPLFAHANRFGSSWPDTDFSQVSIDLAEVMSGGPPKDGIPAIDSPKFDSVKAAGDWLHSREPVIVVEVGQLARAYPLQLLIYHEIVNDVLGEVPVSVTFCPLCNAALAFDRRVDKRVLDFGTTGLLRKSDMVMYDRQTESWWQQIQGLGIVGEMTGVRLKALPAAVVSFEAYAAAYPDGEVLNRDTGHHRPYGNNPYRGYDRIDQTPFLFSDPVDPRLPPMERVLHVTAGGEEKIYPFTAFDETPLVHDELGGSRVVLWREAGVLSPLDEAAITESRAISAVTAWHAEIDGRALHFSLQDNEIRDVETGSRWNVLGQAVEGGLTGKQLTPAQSGNHFAFAWLAFQPDTPIYTP